METFETLSFPDKIAFLENEISRFETFSLIANLGLQTLFEHTYEQEKHYDSMNLLVVEFAALLCLKKNYQQKTTVDLDDYFLLLKNLHEKINITTSLFKKEKENFEKPNNYNSDIEWLARMLTIQQMFLRNPVPKVLHQEVIKNIFKPFTDKLKTHFRFNAEEAITLSNTAGKLHDEILEEEKKIANDRMYLCLREFELYKSKGVSPKDPLVITSLAYLLTLSKENVKEFFKYNITLHDCILNPDAHTFTADELSEASGIDIVTTKAYLDQFSLQFGDVPINFIQPNPNHQLKKKPFIHNDGRYQCPSTPLLDWAIEPLFEELLKHETTYSELRHDIIVEIAINTFGNLYPEATINTHLKYNNKVNELDGLILYDDCAIIIECKGNRITDRAKSGKIDRVERHINELINKSHEQSTTAIDFLKSSAVVEFFPKKGKKVSVDTSKIKRYYPISLTIEPLSSLAILIKQVNNLGINAETFPWIINIYELLVITEQLSLPPALFHYIERRLDFAKDKRAMTHDELDVFAWYMEYGLDLSLLNLKNYDLIYFGDSSKKLNEYYNHKAREGKKRISKIKMKIPLKFMHLLIAIETSKLYGRTQIIVHLLNEPEERKKKLMELVEITRKKHMKDRDIHDFSVYSNDSKIGFTYIISNDKVELNQMLELFCSKRIKEHKPRYWIGIGDIGNKDYKIEVLKLLS